jgi:hypothetical protein
VQEKGRMITFKIGMVHNFPHFLKMIEIKDDAMGGTYSMNGEKKNAHKMLVNLQIRDHLRDIGRNIIIKFILNI